MPQKKTIKGFYKSHKMGYGFVKPISGQFNFEVFIPKSATGCAVEGDLVEVQILNKDIKGYDGKVTKIIERKINAIAGVVTECFPKYVLLLCPLLGTQKQVKIPLPKGKKFKVGDRIYADLIPSKDKKDFLGKFKSYLGKLEDAFIDTDAAIYEFALRREFPKDVIEEIKSLPSKIDPKAYPERLDLQKTVCFTIDPKTAKDYDDAISLERHPDATFTLGVHIADVSYFVPEGSFLDQEAFLRCNSTYFPDTCISMLPKKLADDLCSLKPKVPRLAVSTFMHIDTSGEVIDFEVKRTIIESKERFSYEEVRDILDGKKKHSLKPKLIEIKEAALILKKARKKRGCVDLALADSKIILDSKGEPKKIEVVEYDITHQMIEEFMLKNNEVIARHLSDKEREIPFRVHEEPKAENLASFVQIVESMGFTLSKKPTQEEIQKVFEEVKGSQLEQQLSVHFIKSMKLAYYSKENLGHYGLQLHYYTHFTSPIRRYVDLIVHRRLFGGAKEANIDQVAERCSDQERLSAKAENRVKSLKILRLFQKNGKGTKYKGVITKIKHFGVFFEIPEMLYEGFIHVSELGDDYYIFDQTKNRFKGERKGVIFESGKSLIAKIKSINLIEGEVEWVGVKGR